MVNPLELAFRRLASETSIQRELDINRLETALVAYPSPSICTPSRLIIPRRRGDAQSTPQAGFTTGWRQRKLFDTNQENRKQAGVCPMEEFGVRHRGERRSTCNKMFVV